MKEAILTLIEGAEGTNKPSKQDICKAVLEILSKAMQEGDLGIMAKFALADAKDQFAKDRYFEKYGTTEALSWQADAYEAGSTSSRAMAGHFRTLRTSND